MVFMFFLFICCTPKHLNFVSLCRQCRTLDELYSFQMNIFSYKYAARIISAQYIALDRRNLHIKSLKFSIGTVHSFYYKICDKNKFCNQKPYSCYRQFLRFSHQDVFKNRKKNKLTIVVIEKDSIIWTINYKRGSLMRFVSSFLVNLLLTPNSFCKMRD